MSKKEVSIELERWPIANLTPYELNVKKHDSKQVAAIAQAIQRFGFDQPIVVDKNGVIIKGHGRRLAAIELGMKEVPVWCRRDLSVDEVRAARLADNRVAISDIDTDMLRIELSTLDADLTGIFDAKEIDFVKADLGVMNMDAFVEDMNEVLEGQRQENEERQEKLIGATARVALAKAFGFKDISAAGHIAIVNLMSKAEASTGLKNDEALVAFCSNL